MGNIITILETDAEKVALFLKNEVAKIAGVATTVESDVESAVGLSINVVNALKDFIASPEGKLIEDVISAVPGVGPYLTALLNFLPTLMADLGWAQAEFTKSPAQVVTDGLIVAVNSSGNVKASNLITVAGHIITLITGLQKAPVSIQAAISLVPANYATLPVATVKK